MGRWADRLLFWFVIATMVASLAVAVMAVIDPVATRGALEVMTVPMLVLVVPAAIPLYLLLRRPWLALECLPPYSHEARDRKR